MTAVFIFDYTNGLRNESPLLVVQLHHRPDLAVRTFDQFYHHELAAVVVFEDIERRHIHIVSLRVGLDGRKLVHDFETRRSREILDVSKKFCL